jgi:murein tripeptide amidase MpaA
MYHNLAEFVTGLEALATAYPDTCQLLSLPYGIVEGRTVYAVRLGADGDRLAVLLVGGFHAREWVPPEICLSLAADLLEAYDSGTGLSYAGVAYSAAQIRQIMETFHIYVVPVGNPDGLEYSKANDAVGEFLGWRRNRNPANSGGVPDCIGVDLNRNYDFLWDFEAHMSPQTDLTRVSDDPCNINQVYHGPAPNSEQETKNITWMLDTFPKIHWFLDIHSYAELILYSWGHDESQTTDPSQSFSNPVHDGARGISSAVADDAYSEYMDANDLAVYQNLAKEMRLGIEAVNGRSYAAKDTFGLYPTTGTSSDYGYARHIVDPGKSKVYSFTLEAGREFRPPWAEAESVIREVSSGLLRFLLQAPGTTWPLTVAPPVPLEIHFLNVPEGLTTYRAIVFQVRGCGPARFRIISGPTVTSGPAGTLLGTPCGLSCQPADPRPDSKAPAYARVWISYTGTSDGDIAGGTVRVRCDETGEEWDILIRANTTARPNVAVMLALDQSASMDDPAGDLGARRVDVLRQAAARFVELVPQNNGVGIVRFDHDAYPVDDPAYPGFPVTRITTGDVFDVGRMAVRSAAMAHSTNLAGATSIGNGVVMAHNALIPVTGYREKAIVVFTAGIENREARISSVMGSIDSRTFAIGLGTETQASTAALMALTGARNGYLLLTGHLRTGTDDYFRLTKYVHQILAAVTRTDIVRDPSGHIAPGCVHRIPFTLTEADVEATVILLTDIPAVRFYIETPEGDVLDPGVAGGLGVTFTVGTDMSFYRFGLPLQLGAHGARAGTWHALLQVDAKLFQKYLSNLEGDEERMAFVQAHGVRYSLSVHTYSNLHLRARVDQDSLEPGANLTVRAVLSEYDVPVEKRAKVVAEIERPDRTTASLSLRETDPGIFETHMVASMSGLYRLRIRAQGRTRRGGAFTREQSLTAAVFQGGDGPPPFGGSDAEGRDEAWDELKSLLKTPAGRAVISRLYEWMQEN